MIYIITGNPIPLARPRLCRKRVYDKQTHLKLVAGINLKNQHANLPFYDGFLHLDVTFYLAIPEKSLSKKKQSSLNGRYHIYRPDLSNLIKFVEDIGTGIIYKDDSLICSITASKKYSTHPRTEFELRAL